MKVSEMNAHQRKAFYNIKHAANWLLGGLENTMQDYRETDEEYKNAAARLADHDGLVNELYNMATSELYGDGFCAFNSSATRYLKDIRFCGRDFLLARCEARITKEGY